MNVEWYLDWFNSQEQKKCPECGERVVAKKNTDGEVYIDVQHKPDCKLHIEWIQFEKDHPGVSPGALWLEWIHRNDGKD